jgi:EmrB/QacA subfamily drug resistance transporter
MTAGQAWALGLASAGAFMIQMDIQVVATALVAIHRDLQASLESLEWTIDAYLLTFAALMLTAAGLGDRIGRRRTFIAGLGVFVVGSAACALAPNAGVLIAARALQGVGAAVVMPLSLTILSAAFPARTRGRALGLYAGLGGVATGVGPLLGGVIAESLSWQWVFWINVPVGLLTMVLVALRIKESRGPTKRLDPVGVALVSVGTLALVWGLARSNTAGWGSHWIVSTLVAGTVLLAAFAVWELRARAPMLPMLFFRFRAFSAGNAVNVSLFAVMYGILFLVAQYFQQGLGYGPTAAGLRLMPLTGTLMLIAPFAGHLADRGGERRVAAGGLALLVIGLVGLAVSVRLAPGYPAMVAPLVLLGVGASACIPAAQKAVVGAVAREEIGRASGAFSMLRILSGALGLAVAGAVFAAAGGHESAAGFASGLVPGIVVTAAIGALGFAAALAIPRQGIP